MLTYNSYHTHLKCLARENLLSKEISIQIPRSNIWRWKNEPSDKYQSFDLNLRASDDYEVIRSFSQSRKAKRIFSAYVRLSKFFVDLAHGIPKFHKHVVAGKQQAVRIIERVKGELGLRNVLRAFNISVHTFRQWKLDTFTSCFNSFVNRCNRIYPTQLSKPEITLMKEKLTDRSYQYWPISSIALGSLRNNSLPLSLNTWYKYSKRLGITRPRPADRKKKRLEGVRATRPNQIWHADITRFVTADNMIHYIYFIIDNFSRKILSWFVADKVSFLIRRQTIDMALTNVKDQQKPIVLLTDGGPENSLKEYLKMLSVPLTHERALIDVHYSNSLIEGHHKVIKYNYLYRMPIENRNQLIKQLEWVCDDFDNRPHISLSGLTPNEAHRNVKLDYESLKNLKKVATQIRKENNIENQCAACSEI